MNNSFPKIFDIKAFCPWKQPIDPTQLSHIGRQYLQISKVGSENKILKDTFLEKANIGHGKHN